MSVINRWLTPRDENPYQRLREGALRTTSFVNIAVGLSVIPFIVLVYWNSRTSHPGFIQLLSAQFFIVAASLIVGILIHHRRYLAASLLLVASFSLTANALIFLNGALFSLICLGLDMMALMVGKLTLPRPYHKFIIPVQVSLISLTLLILNLMGRADLTGVTVIHVEINWLTRLQIAASGVFSRVAFLSMTSFLLNQLIGLYEGRIELEEDLRKQAEAEHQKVEYLLRKATEANRLKDEFLASVSHELNTPLNAILGSSTLLVHDKVRDPSLRKEHLESINQSAHRFRRIIQSLLDYSLTSSRRIELHMEEVCLHDIVQVSCRKFDSEACAKSIALNVKVNADAPTTIYTDAGRFTQILDNLLNNAFKFTQAGSVTITIMHDQVIVADTGCGIHEDIFKHLFTPFQQGYDIMRTPHQGARLGLAISKELADVLGCTLTAESQVGLGTRMILTLPSMQNCSN